MMKGNKVKAFVLDWVKLPEKIKHIILPDERRKNDCYVEFYSELSMENLKRGMPALEEYWKDQSGIGPNSRTDKNKFTGTFDEFIQAYGLAGTKWIIEQNFDLADVDLILIKISW
jgi:hypothetical protein